MIQYLGNRMISGASTMLMFGVSQDIDLVDLTVGVMRKGSC